MIFKFLNKKIVLDCFTTESYVIEYSPIDFAIKHIPDWWKSLPQSYYVEESISKKPTMKYCFGMTEYYKKSIAIPLWSDLQIAIKDNNFQWQFSDQKTLAICHNAQFQATNFLPTFKHFKICSPWLFKTKEDINWVWSHPAYNYAHSNDLVSLPGITNFLYGHSTNINMMVNTNVEKNIIANQGKPIGLLTPMSDRKIEIVRHLISHKEFDSLNFKQTPITFINKYNNIVKRKKQFEDCPYHNKIMKD